MMILLQPQLLGTAFPFLCCPDVLLLADKGFDRADHRGDGRLEVACPHRRVSDVCTKDDGLNVHPWEFMDDGIDTTNLCIDLRH